MGILNDMMPYVRDDSRYDNQLSKQQHRQLKRGSSPEDYSALRAEIEQEPEYFGGGDENWMTGQNLTTGKVVAIKPRRRIDTQTAENWMTDNANKRENARKDKLAADAQAIEMQKANVPIEAAKVNAGVLEKQMAAQALRDEAERVRRADETTYQRGRDKISDEYKMREAEAAQAARIRDLNEGVSQKAGRRSAALGQLSGEVAAMPFDQAEQTAALNRLRNTNPDLADLTDQEFDTKFRTYGSAAKAEQFYADRIGKLAQLIADNDTVVSDADEAEIVAQGSALLSDAKQNMKPDQFAEFAKRLRASLQGKVGNSFIRNLFTYATPLGAPLAFVDDDRTRALRTIFEGR
jgi:hypothetical protein